MAHTLARIENYIVSISDIVAIQKLFEKDKFIGIRITFNKGAQVVIYETEVATTICEKIMAN